MVSGAALVWWNVSPFLPRVLLPLVMTRARLDDVDGSGYSIVQWFAGNADSTMNSWWQVRREPSTSWRCGGGAFLNAGNRKSIKTVLSKLGLKTECKVGDLSGLTSVQLAQSIAVSPWPALFRWADQPPRYWYHRMADQFLEGSKCCSVPMIVATRYFQHSLWVGSG